MHRTGQLLERTPVCNRPQKEVSFCGKRCRHRLTEREVFITNNVVHAQYISANEFGRESGALDKLFDYLISNFQLEKDYFDFGICNELDGRKINHGLLEWKESFGGKVFIHEFYDISTCNYINIENIIKHD